MSPEAPHPDTAPSGPYATAAPTYWQAGWRGILPLPARAKTPVPKGWTGRDGAWPSYPDVMAWADDHPDGNIALRLPPDVLGIDVDHYDAKPGGLVLTQLETDLGALPATWRTTSRDDGTSGIRLFRIPTGLRWPGVLGPGIETIRFEHRYAVAWPSTHPEGGTYRWIRPDGTTSLHEVPTVEELPELPDTWVAHFTGGELATDQPKADLGDTAAAAWLETRGGGYPCRRIEDAATRARAFDPTAGARHDTMLAATNRLIWLAGEGHPGATTVLGQLRAAFLTATAGDRAPGEAENEWDRAVVGAVRIAAAAHPDPHGDPCSDPFAGLIARKDQPCQSTPTTPSSASPTPSTASPTSSPTPPSPNESAQPSPTSPSATTSPADATQQDETDNPPASWARTDLTAYVDGTHQPIAPALLPRSDGICLVYPGLTHSFHGESESGKSMVLQYEAARLITAGRPVLYVDFESDAPAVTERLTMFGATRDAILNHFDYRTPEVSPNASAAELQAWGDMLTGTYDLAVIDGVTDSLGVFGLSTKDNDEIAKWARILPRQIASKTGAAVCVIDHVTKDSETRGRFAIGGQAKIAGLTGAAYTVEIAEPLGRGLRGVIVLRVGKDRPGYVRGHSAPMRSDRTQEAARVILDSTSEHVTVTVEARTGADVPREQRRPMRFTGVMEKVSKALEKASTPLSTRALRELVGGNKDRLASAVSDLLADGYITVCEGERGATMHELVRVYRQRTDPRSDLYDPLDPDSIKAQNGVTEHLETSTVADRGSPWPTVAEPRCPATVAPAPHPVGGRATVGEVEATNDRGPAPTPDSDRLVTRSIAGKPVTVNLDTGEVVDR